MIPPLTDLRGEAKEAGEKKDCSQKVVQYLLQGDGVPINTVWETIEGGGNHSVRCRKPREADNGNQKPPPCKLSAEVDADVGLDQQPGDQQAGEGDHHHRHLHILLGWNGHTHMALSIPLSERGRNVCPLSSVDD